MPVTYDDYIKGGGLNSDVSASAQAGLDSLRVDMFHPKTNKTYNMPIGSGLGVLNRETMGGSYGNSPLFGDSVMADEKELPAFIQSAGQGLEDFVAGAGSQVTGVFTRFPAIVAQEFSDLIGNGGREMDGVIGQVFTHLDNIADEISQSMMDKYYQTLDSNGWAFDEGEQPSFMFKMGSGAASLAEAMGISMVTGNPVAAAAFFGALQQTETYAKAIAAGKSPRDAFMIANTAGITMGLLERIGIKMLMKAASDPLKKFAQRAAEGALTESLQEGAQEASVIGIEGITGVDNLSMGQAASQIGESALIGGILGGIATPSMGAFSDRQQGKSVRAGKIDQSVVDDLMDGVEANIRNGVSTEKEVWASAMLANPNTDAGKRLKAFQKKVIDIVNSKLDGQEFHDVFKTEREQQEYMKSIVAKMSVANEAESRVIATSKLRDINTTRKKLAHSQSQLEKSGASLVEKYADKFDSQDLRQKYLKDVKGKSTHEALILMRKELRAVRKAKESATSAEELLGAGGLNAQEQSLEDTIEDFELLNSQQLEAFNDKTQFDEGLEGLPEYQKIAKEARIIEQSIADKEQEYKEWSERTNQPEIFDFVKDERISMKGEALRRLTKDQSINAFMKGISSGRKITESFFVDVIGSLERFIKAMPALKGTTLDKESKRAIKDKLSAMKDKIATKEMSQAQIEEQADIIADTIEDMITVAGNMTSESAYKLYKKDLKKMLKKTGKSLDKDLNNALGAMKSMITSKKGYHEVWEAIDEEYGNMYRPMIDKMYQVMSQEEMKVPVADKDDQGLVVEGELSTVDAEILAEGYAGLLDAVEYMVNYGYVPDSRYIARAAQLQAVKVAIGDYNESISDKRLSKVRKSKKYAVVDGFFNFNFETLNTLWVKLGLQDIDVLDMTKADMGFRNDKVRWTKRIKGVAEKLGLDKKDFESWTSLDSEEAYTLERKPSEKKDSSKLDGPRFKTYNLTKAMVMQRVMNLKNKEVREQMMNPNGLGYTESFIKELEDSLSDKEQAFIDEILGVYKELFGEVSPVYSDLYLMDMPFVENYSPLVREREGGKTIEINDIKFLGPNGLAIPSLTKNRTQSNLDFMDSGIVDVLTHYVESAMYFKNYQEQVADVSNILADKNVKRGIIKSMGTRGYKRLINHIDYIKDMPKRHSKSRNELWDYFNKVYIVNKLMFKPNQIFKQYASAFGLIEDVPFSYSSIHMHKMFNPLSHKRWRKIFEQNETFRNRSEHIDADYNLLLDNETIGIFSEQNRIVKAGMKPTVIGDSLAIVAGGGLYYDYLVDKMGMSQKEAVDTVIRKAEMSQQSSLPSNMTLLQKDDGAFARTIRMFSSSAIALMNMQMQAWAKYRSGEINKRQLFKNLALYQFVVPAFYAMMAGQISFDDEDELAWGLMHVAMKGNFGSLPIVGEGMDAITIQAINSMTGAELTSYGIRDIENPLGEFYKITMKGMKAATGEEEFTEEEQFRVILELIDSTSRLGSENVFNAISGVVDVAGSGSPEGLLRMFGYSEKTAENLIGNK